MTQIILTHDQARAFQAAGESVELRDEGGNLLGIAAPKVTDKAIADAKARLNSDGPWHTTEEVLDHLRSLEQR